MELSLKMGRVGANWLVDQVASPCKLWSDLDSNFVFTLWGCSLIDCLVRDGATPDRLKGWSIR